MLRQVEISLPPYKRGYHLVTAFITDELGSLPDTGVVSLFIMHTSAALSINENADPDVRYDFESFLNKLIPENDPVYSHILEGPDDIS